MGRVLGIDPGLRLTGFAVVDHGDGVRVPGVVCDARLVEAGVVRLNPRESVEQRLVQLYEDIVGVIDEVQPGVMAVEKLYAHYKHPTTAIVMGHARGVILLAAKQKGLDVCHLAATEVKKAVTGNGHASKEQIQRSVQAVFRLDKPPSPPDVADAIAIALASVGRIEAVAL